ncbi:MAG: aspartyl protease family protein [Candidatus Rokuibacteriota bacterium]
MPSAGFLLLALLIVLAGSADPAAAQFFRWTDERGVTHYAEGLDSVPERHRATARALGYRNSPTPPPGAATEKPKSAETVIRFTPGRHIVVDARVNGSASAKLILDTGAGSTLISPRVLAAAGVSLTRGTVAARTRGVASGTDVDLQLVQIDSLSVGDAQAGRMVVSSYEMNMPDVDGLLGQDFLARFTVQIDPTAGVVTLSPK